jgi:hypothetical protein
MSLIALHSPLRLASLLATLGLALTGCAEGSFGDLPGVGSDDPTPTATVREVLAGPVHLAIAPSTEHLSGAAITAAGGPGDLPTDLAIDITGGSLDARIVDDRLILLDLEVTTGDLEVPATLLPPRGGALRDVELTLDGPASGVMTAEDDDLAVTEVEVDASIAWSLELDGVVHELAPIQLRGLHLVMVAEAVDGDASVRLSGSQAGMLWSWLDRFSLSDLELNVGAR